MKKSVFARLGSATTPRSGSSFAALFRAASATAIVSAMVAANPAAGQTYTSTQAISNTGAPVGPWSTTSRAGVNCNVGTPVDLQDAYANGTVLGRDGNLQIDQPLVARNTAVSTYTYTDGMVVPGGRMIMHPSDTGQCAILRLTVPTSGTYAVSATFVGAYPNAGVSNGDGVNAMLLANGVQVGNIVDTARGAGRIVRQVVVCQGQTIDFAVNRKSSYLYDSTLLDAEVTRVVGAPPPPQCEGGPPYVVPQDPQVGPSSCCAPWSELNIPGALMPVFTNAGAPFGMQYQSQPGIEAQMSAYLNYIHAMDPSITELVLTWRAVDVGNTPGYSGTVVGGVQTVKWTWSSTGVSVAPSTGAFWAGMPFQQNRWYRFATQLSHNGTPNSPYFGRNCIDNSRAYRWGASARVGAAGASDGIVVSTVGARGQIVEAQPVPLSWRGRMATIPLPQN